MALKKTVEDLKMYLHEISYDLEKAGRGNKAAAQRVRTNTIKFAKLAKQYRKESISEGSKKAKKSTRKKTVAKKKTVKKAAAKKTTRKKTVARKKTTTRKKAAARRR